MISIIIPILNNFDFTQECVYSIMDCTQDYEIVFVDNGSDPPYKPPFISNGGSQLIRNSENLGFPIAMNQGIKAAKGDVIVMFNNDIVVTPGWADKLLSYIEGPDPDFDIIAPMTNYVAGLQNTSIDNYDTKEQLYAAGQSFSEQNDGQATEVRWAILSMFIRKDLFNEIGFLDESLFPCCGEDIDICFRAREAGKKIGVAHDVYIHHYGSRTFDAIAEDGGIKYDDIVKQNNEFLVKKWGPGVWDNQVIYEDKQIGVKEGLRLNLGSGGYNLKGFVNIDQLERVDPDKVADVTNLDYEKDTVEEIYCGHLLEHLTWNEGQNALMHWYRILKPGGEIRVVVPDFDKIAAEYLKNPIPSEMIKLNNLFIYSYIQHSLHRFFYSSGLLKYAMTEAGFINLEQMPSDHEYLVEDVSWQVGWKGAKP